MLTFPFDISCTKDLFIVITKFIFSVSWVIVAGATAALAQPTFESGSDPKPAGKEWVKIDNLTDEFDGNTLDMKKWHSDPTDNGWTWVGRPPALFVPENVSVKDGEMKVTVSKLKKPFVKGKSTFTHQGAIVRSRNPGQVGSYFECRMKANQTIMSSTFWLSSKFGPEGRQELDIQECVGRMSKNAAPWAKDWDQKFHSNVWQWPGSKNPTKLQLQAQVRTETKNWERFYIYGAWWKSPEEIRFYLDGKYAYSIKPKTVWNRPAFITMAIETYDWNPLPADGGLVESGTVDQRTTRYDWVRSWKLK